MDRSQIKVQLGGLTLILNLRSPCLHLSPGRCTTGTTHDILGDPRFHDGTRADHLSVPFEPRRDLPNALNVHLTWSDRHHVRLALVPLASLRRLGESFEARLRAELLPQMRRVTRAVLVRNGVEVSGLNARARAAMSAVVESPAPKYRLDRVLRRATQQPRAFIDVARADAFDWSAGRIGTDPLQLQVTHRENGRLTTRTVMELTRATDLPGEEPAYVLFPPEQEVRRIHGALVDEMLTTRAARVMLVAMRELGAACDRPRLEHLMRVANVRSARDLPQRPSELSAA